MKNLLNTLFVATAVCGLVAACPAQAAPHKGAVRPAAEDDDSQAGLYTSRGTSGVLALDNLHENGATCLTCSNGVYGTSGTRNMRSNEY